MFAQVSFFSSSPELSNKQRFEYFTRTIPSDHHQVEAMVQIIQQLKWTYISILYEESTYGIKVSSVLFSSILLSKGTTIVSRRRLFSGKKSCLFESTCEWGDYFCSVHDNIYVMCLIWRRKGIMWSLRIEREKLFTRPDDVHNIVRHWRIHYPAETPAETIENFLLFDVTGKCVITIPGNTRSAFDTRPLYTQQRRNK